MKRMNRAVACASAAAVLLGLSGAVAQAVDSPMTGPAAALRAPLSDSSDAADAPAVQTGVRIVGAGERVAVTPDASVWLTEGRRMCDQVMRSRPASR
jgi:hypothetical protein